jgi:uncharacterized membrane protein YphA (DoxX/SURF4 family)
VSRALWVAQVLLAVLFLWAGGFKLIASAEQMAGPGAPPAAFLRFIGVVELLGALGLILPGLTGIRPGLTPLAAAGLVIVMAGAVALTLAGGGGVTAMVPLVVGVLAAWIAYARWRLAPHRARGG